MGKNQMVGIMEKEISETALSKEQMVTIAKAIREPMWQWHVIFAHVVIFAFLIRIIYMLAQGIRFPNPFKTGISVKEKLQGFTYIYFYFFVLVSAITGISLRLGLFAAWKDIIESIHKLGIYWFPIFILLHLAGVLRAEFSNKKGIVSKMISGE